MVRKGKTTQKAKERFSSKQLMLISIIIASAIIFVPILFSTLSQKPGVFVLTAAIIDQLWEEHPNPTFVGDVTTLLKRHNFTVTHYKENLDVDFFKGLAKEPYGIVILRAHSALRNDSSTVDFFTNEPYNSARHEEYREKEWLVSGKLNISQNSKEYFAFTFKFIENLKGRFPKSIVVAMGCWSLKPGLEETAEAFLYKGAIAYIGWTHMVDVLHTDNETLRLLIMMLDQNLTLENAVIRTEPDWHWAPPKSEMTYHPESARTLRLSDLMAKAETPAPSNTAFNNLHLLVTYVTRITQSQIRKPEYSLHWPTINSL